MCIITTIMYVWITMNKAFDHFLHYLFQVTFLFDKPLLVCPHRFVLHQFIFLKNPPIQIEFYEAICFLPLLIAINLIYDLIHPIILLFML
jgi:hypothetical protein